MLLDGFEIFEFEIDKEDGIVRSCWALLGLSTIPAGLVEVIEAISRLGWYPKASAATAVIKKQPKSV